MSIWCIFSLSNNYDQPPNNLVAWWKDKPDLTMLAREFFNKELTDMDNDEVVMTVELWQGRKIDYSNTAYLLKHIKEQGIIGELEWTDEPPSQRTKKKR